MIQLFEKLDDLKSVFIYGQKIIPIIQSLVDFMKDTVPLLENINNSISESTNKIPKATHHINDVTNATELATTEILDIVDIISDELGDIETKLSSLTEKENERSEILNKLETILSGNDDALELVKKLRNDYSTADIVSSVLDKIKKIKNDSYNITISLQVQDITSQQLAAVNHLIESVQNRLSSLILDISDKELKDFQNMEIEIDEKVHFDPNARYNKETKNQDLADSLVNDNNKLKTSQEEIDKLFS